MRQCRTLLRKEEQKCGNLESSDLERTGGLRQEGGWSRVTGQWEAGTDIREERFSAGDRLRRIRHQVQVAAESSLVSPG